MQILTFSVADLLFFANRRTEKAVAVTKLEELGDLWRDYDVLGIDEGQFYLDVSRQYTAMLLLYGGSKASNSIVFNLGCSIYSKICRL